jgi:hypothetical protein
MEMMGEQTCEGFRQLRLGLLWFFWCSRRLFRHANIAAANIAGRTFANHALSPFLVTESFAVVVV